MRWAIFGLILLLVAVAGFSLIAWRIGVLFEPPRRRRVRRVIAGLGALVYATVILRFIAGEGAFVDLTAWVGFIGMAIASFLLTIVVIRDGVWLVARAGLWLRARLSDAGEPLSPARRRLLTRTVNLGQAGVTVALLGYGLQQARSAPPVRRVAVPIDGLAPELEGFRIAQITDLHVGPTIKADYVQTVVDAINALDVDMVALTGDLVDGSVDHLSDDVAPLGGLRSRHGSYMCTGNHEYYAGVDAWLAHFATLGIEPLNNQHVVREHDGARFVVAGVTDVREGERLGKHKSDPAKALQGAPQDVFRLLLAHQPKSILAAALAGVSLQLSGHTHGGQFFPWNFFAGLGQPYVAGLHRHGAAFIYVSRGTGYWGPPVRVGAPSEITLIELVRA